MARKMIAGYMDLDPNKDVAGHVKVVYSGQDNGTVWLPWKLTSNPLRTLTW